MANRNLKVSLSIGGWTYSQDGHFSFVTDAGKRATFVQNAVQLISDYGFDGIDIDFEYPSSPQQGQGFADLCTALRTAFDQLASSKGDSTPYLLTVRIHFQFIFVRSSTDECEGRSIRRREWLPIPCCSPNGQG